MRAPGEEASAPPPPSTAVIPGPPPGTPLMDAPPLAASARTGRRRTRWLVTVIVLGVALLAVLGYVGYLVVQLNAAIARIDDQQRQIEKLQDIIDTKQTFDAAMQKLVATTSSFDGLPFTTIVPDGRIASLATRGWDNRRDIPALRTATSDADSTTEELQTLLDAAQAQAGSNASGTVYEATIDSLGHGFVTTAIDDADALCDSDVLGCVMSDDPYTVHIDSADVGQPWMTDFIATGIAYHEFAHVLQNTNPVQTETAAAAFDGDWETMADCFALTYLDGWSLDQRVWVSSYEYYDVSVGYGYTCDEGQRQVVRGWYTGLPRVSVPVSE